MGTSKCYNDETFIRLLKGLGAGAELDNAVSSRTPYLLVSDNGVISEYSGYGESISNGKEIYEFIKAHRAKNRSHRHKDPKILPSHNHIAAAFQKLFWMYSAKLCSP